jgi:outer membrane protein OmpA-like peptidoglycan-associated protein
VGAVSAGAQVPVPGFDLDRVVFNGGARETLIINSGDVLKPQHLRIGIWGHYLRDGLVLNTAGARVGSVVGNRVTGHLIGHYGISEYFDVGLQLPLVLSQDGDDLTARGLSRIEASGLGAPTLQGRFALFRQGRDDDPMDLAISLGVNLPFGSSGAFTRDPGLGFALAPRVGGGYSFGPVRVGAELGSQVRGSTGLSPANPALKDEIGSAFTWGAAVSTTRELHPLRGELGAIGNVPFTRAQASSELLAAARIAFGERQDFEASLLFGMGLGRTPGTPAFRGALGLAWVPDFAQKAPAKPTCVEGQPYVTELCPELDKDGDAMRNGVDRCPETFGVSARMGCPDIDTDGDGVLDLDDKCPNVTGLKEFNGCPPPDRDGDTVIDPVDACPDERGLVERKGCPIRDADKDGIEDPSDACRDEPGIAELKGCPDRDGDGDTVVDRFDNCPKEPGPPDNQGCPKKQRQLVIITKEKLVIKEKVFFATAKSTILPKSFPLLTQIANVLKDHPEIGKIRVEGHTDNRGQHDYNVKLSQDRAASVKQFLVEKGVAADRLDARGFGPDQPADTNVTDKGRENNRRVEFMVEN